MITRAGEEPVCNVRVSDPAISDHCAVHRETLCLIKPSFERKTITYQKLRSLDSGLFIQDIMNSKLMNHNFTDVSVLTDCHPNTLWSLLDKYASAKSRVVTMKTAAPWYSDHIRLEKTKRKKLECKWRRDKLTIHREMYVEQCARVNKLIHNSKMQFYANVINGNANNQRVLCLSIGKMLNLKADRKLQSHENERDLANSFVDFFSDKVQGTRMSLPPATVSSCLNINTACNDNCPGFSLTSVKELCEFSPTSVNELSSLLKTMSSKSRVLDPIQAILMTVL